MSDTSFMFNNLGGIRNDTNDQSQQNLQNTRFANYMLSNYGAEKIDPNNVIDFASSQPVFIMNGASRGSGLNGQIIDTNSQLTILTEQERPLDKLQLNERPFLTVPYLGRGSVDPVLESQLLQGEVVNDKKSVSTIMEKSFSDYSLYMVDDNMQKRVEQPEFTVQESALEGWQRGGSNTRVTGDSRK